ncbi:MAG: Mrp/NBP35 family ATP-binding protein [Eubacteriales bacterium]|nr:Mrp/NBP35 family ATP-binding protein [Eubacteriales bacterium]
MSKDYHLITDPEERARREAELKAKAAEYLAQKGQSAIQELESNPGSQVSEVIAVMSGKGGVGKSSVTSLLAAGLAKQGYRVGILDADITGPSIPKAFHVEDLPVYQCEHGMLPVESVEGIKILSINLMMDNPADPVVWRGPVIANLVRQFWTDVAWGELDYLFIDMPPGTGDVPLTVYQSLPVTASIIVTSPQDLVSLIVEKSIKMAKQMNIPILALIENFSYFVCPNCNERHDIYGQSHLEDLARSHGILYTARVPIDRSIAASMDAGQIEAIDRPELENLIGALMLRSKS